MPVALTVACLPLPLPWSCVSVSILPNSISNSTKWGTTFCIAWLKISLPIFHLTSIRTGKRRKLSLKTKRFFVLVEVSTTVGWQNAFPVTNGCTLDALAVEKQKKCKKRWDLPIYMQQLLQKPVTVSFVARYAFCRCAAHVNMYV